MIENKTRNYGMDLLRIVAMYFVVVLHICNYGGVENTASGIFQQGICCIYKTLTCTAVNVFALISGYVGYCSKKLKLSRFIELWMMVVFYSVIIAAIMLFVGTEGVGYSELLKACLPVTLNSYWYFSAYAGLFFLIPIINRVLDTLTREYFVKTAFAAVALFSVYGLISSYFNDPFGLKSGYSLLWLGVLYYLGAGLRRFDFGAKIKAQKLAAAVGAVWAVSASLAITLAWIVSVVQMEILTTLADYVFFSYLSPIVVLLSVMMCMLFSKWSAKPRRKKLLTTCSSSAFAVYIIHTNPLFWEHWFTDAFCFIATYTGFAMLVCIPVAALAVFLVCLGIDILRAKLFVLLGIRALAQRAEILFSNKFEKLVKVLH